MDVDEPKMSVQLHDLHERAKELRCLYQVNELLNRSELSLAQILRGIVNVLPPAWQYPEQCQARIVFEDRVFESYDYRPSQWVQTANIVVQGEKSRQHRSVVSGGGARFGQNPVLARRTHAH